MYKKHSFEEKLRCMKLLDEGYPMRRLAKESGIRRNQLYDLRKRYLAYGVHSHDIDPHSYDVDPLEEGRAFKEQSLFACKQAAA